MIRIAALLAVVMLAASASAQDIRGVEVCTAEKDMVRRTSCLQANVQFLQGALDKATREAAEKLATANREIAAQKAELSAQKAEVASVKDALAKVQADLADLKKSKPVK